MKRTLSIFGQFLLFFVADFIGSFVYHPFGFATALTPVDSAPRSFLWDGLILAALVYLLVVLVEALRKQLKSGVSWSTLALLLAALAGYLLKFGFITHGA